MSYTTLLTTKRFHVNDQKDMFPKSITLVIYIYLHKF